MRAPGPWRPTKLRFEVEAQRSPAGTLSGFIPRQAEQPGSRHSNPASVKILSKPSSSAIALTRPDPGTTMAQRILPALRLPSSTLAAARRSSIRELVQEPMKMFSTGISVIFWPALSPIYSRLFCAACCLEASAKSCGEGTMPPIATTSSGEVPQVTVGSTSLASIVTDLSKRAPSSLWSVFQ